MDWSVKHCRCRFNGNFTETINWLKKHTNGDYTISGLHITFGNPVDATFFRLTKLYDCENA